MYKLLCSVCSPTGKTGRRGRDRRNRGLPDSVVPPQGIALYMETSSPLGISETQWPMHSLSRAIPCGCRCWDDCLADKPRLLGFCGVSGLVWKYPFCLCHQVHFLLSTSPALQYLRLAEIGHPEAKSGKTYQRREKSPAHLCQLHLLSIPTIPQELSGSGKAGSSTRERK